MIWLAFVLGVAVGFMWACIDVVLRLHKHGKRVKDMNDWMEGAG